MCVNAQIFNNLVSSKLSYNQRYGKIELYFSVLILKIKKNKNYPTPNHPN